MQRPVEITFHNVDHSDAIEADVRRRVAKLERYYQRISGCRVAIEAPHGQHRKGNTFEVRIELTIPGREPLVVSRDPGDRSSHFDPFVAVRDAFRAAERMLETHVAVLRGAVKSHPPEPVARVARLFPEEGYGFLTTLEGREIYFHENSVARGYSFADLSVGDEVRFEEREGLEGPQASTVHPV